MSLFVLGRNQLDFTWNRLVEKVVVVVEIFERSQLLELDWLVVTTSLNRISNFLAICFFLDIYWFRTCFLVLTCVPFLILIYLHALLNCLVFLPKSHSSRILITWHMFLEQGRTPHLNIVLKIEILVVSLLNCVIVCIFSLEDIHFCCLLLGLSVASKSWRFLRKNPNIFFGSNNYFIGCIEVVSAIGIVFDIICVNWLNLTRVCSSESCPILQRSDWKYAMVSSFLIVQVILMWFKQVLEKILLFSVVC